MAVAGQTKWHPRTVLEPKKWLLANGEIVQEPPLEETTSGRKVRITGTTTSMFARDINDLIFQGVQALAQSKGTSVWMIQDDTSRKYQEEVLYDKRLVDRNLELHVLDTSKGVHHTTAWWKFRHPSLPIEATLVVEMRNKNFYQYGRYYPGGEQMLTTELVLPSTNSAHADMLVVKQMNEMNGDNLVDTVAQRLKFTELVRDNPPNWASDITLQKDKLFNSPRLAVKALLEAIRAVDGYDKIDVPDLRNPDEPTWMELELHDTNVSGSFIQSLMDYLDGSNVVEQVHHLYNEMARLMRSTGVVFPELEQDTFITALAGGGEVEVPIQTKPAEKDNQQDTTHSVVLHLPSGTLIVNCSQRGASRDEIAEKWEEARVMASLTGQEDELLAYAFRYKETVDERRAKQILKERKEPGKGVQS